MILLQCHRVAAVGAITLLCAGCGLLGGLPSQSHPSCSWTTQPPNNPDSVCATVFSTLRMLALADLNGDDATIHRLVTSPAVARRIIAFGRDERRLGLHSLHVTPSLTLGASVNRTLGVGLQLVGQTRGGSLRAPQTIYVRLHGDSATVVDDQPEQEW